MSKILNGEQAVVAMFNGENVEWCINGLAWDILTVSEFMSWSMERFVGKDTTYRFRLKPQFITMNGIKIPAPFKPEDGELYYYLAATREGYWSKIYGKGIQDDDKRTKLGAWRTEEEMQEVVSIFNKAFGVSQNDN